MVTELGREGELGYYSNFLVAPVPSKQMPFFGPKHCNRFFAISKARTLSIDLKHI